jgi:tetratricopeptide (TPR) repeat protein
MKTIKNTFALLIIQLFFCELEAVAQTGRIRPITYIDMGESKSVKDGLRWSRMGLYKTAIPYFNKAIEENPEDYEAYLQRGIAKREIEDYKGAISDLNFFIESNDSDERGYFHRGIAKRKLKDYTGAMSDLNFVIEESERKNKDKKGEEDIFKYDYREIGYFERGLCKFELEDFRGANFDFVRVINLNGVKKANAYFNCGLCKKKLGDSWGALSEMDSAIKLDLKFKEAYFQRGIIKINMGLKDMGCFDLSKAGELGYEKSYDVIKEFCK